MAKVAILIDGGFFLRRLPSLIDRSILSDPERADAAVGRLINGHLLHVNHTVCSANHYSLLYRCFFYDALPYTRQGHLPVSRRAVNYAKSDQANFRLELFERLRHRPNVALRLGEVRRDREWIITESAQKDLLAGRRLVADLTDADFVPGFRQKAVDMRIGLDIASITLKKQADTIVLVTGDSDFVPAAKLARREGTRVILDPLWQQVSSDLFEHIDQLHCPLPRPTSKTVIISPGS
ncbi:MAG: NYN domain-containing protein [Chloroflexi bacterium]|nr:NYN domain-containing protein [Chloroflexota bacterium]